MNTAALEAAVFSRKVGIRVICRNKLIVFNW